MRRRPWRGGAYSYALPGLLSLLSYRTQDHQPRVGTAHNELSPPTPVIHQVDALPANLVWTFSLLRIPFPSDSCFCQIDIKPASIRIKQTWGAQPVVLWLLFTFKGNPPPQTAGLLVTPTDCDQSGNPCINWNRSAGLGQGQRAGTSPVSQALDLESWIVQCLPEEERGRVSGEPLC
jgi:hypothetical protein